MMQIKIRPCEPDDHEAVSGLLLEAFAGKFRTLAAMDGDLMGTLLQAQWLAEWQEPGHRHLLACHSCDVAGTVLMKTASSHDFRQPRPRAWGLRQLARQAGYWQAARFLAGMQFLSYKPQPRECYIGHLAVSPATRGCGIGRQLLQWAQQEVIRDPLLDRLTLHVAASNFGARSLYEQAHFAVQHTYYSPASKLLFKEPRWHYMVWTP